MGLLDYLTTGAWDPPPPPVQRAHAQAASARVQAAQHDAQTHLSQSPTQSSGTLPCGLPRQTHPCDLKDLAITERKTVTKGKAPWVGEGEPPEERELPKTFTIVTTGTAEHDPYITGTIVEVTAGSANETVKTYIDLAIAPGPGFCSEETHPHLVVTGPDGKATVLKGATKHSLTVFRKGRATDANAVLQSFADVWPVRLGFQDYRVSALVCGVRKVGPSVRSQHAAIRVFPRDEWELELKAPSLFKAAVSHSTNSWDSANRTSKTSASVTLEGTTNTRSASVTRSSSASEVSWTAGAERHGGGSASGVERSYTVDRATSRAELSRKYTDTAHGVTGTIESKRASDGSRSLSIEAKEASEGIETRFSAELKRNGTVVVGLEWILAAINALRDIEKAVQDIWETIRKFKPKVGWDFKFGVEVFTGSLEGTWGYRESTDRRVFFAYAVKAKLVLLKVSLSAAFGVDLTIKGYGFAASIELKIDASVSVITEVERKKPEEPEWKFGHFRGNLPATATAKGMCVSDRVLSLRGSVESGFDAKGRLGADDHGLGLFVDKVEFKGIKLKGAATVIGLFDIDGEYEAMGKRVVSSNLRVPG